MGGGEVAPTPEPYTQSLTKYLTLASPERVHCRFMLGIHSWPLCRSQKNRSSESPIRRVEPAALLVVGKGWLLTPVSHNTVPVYKPA